jgi:hypothetical protein
VVSPSTAASTVHRVREPGWPRDLDRFVAWVEQMNADMLAAGEALAQEHSYDLIHGHDWLVAQASATLADVVWRSLRDDDPRDRARPPPGLGRGRAAVAHPRGRALRWPTAPTA